MKVMAPDTLLRLALLAASLLSGCTGETRSDSTRETLQGPCESDAECVEDDCKSALRAVAACADGTSSSDSKGCADAELSLFTCGADLCGADLHAVGDALSYVVDGYSGRTCSEE